MRSQRSGWRAAGGASAAASPTRLECHCAAAGRQEAEEAEEVRGRSSCVARRLLGADGALLSGRPLPSVDCLTTGLVALWLPCLPCYPHYLDAVGTPFVRATCNIESNWSWELAADGLRRCRRRRHAALRASHLQAETERLSTSPVSRRVPIVLSEPCGAQAASQRPHDGRRCALAPNPAQRAWSEQPPQHRLSRAAPAPAATSSTPRRHRSHRRRRSRPA